jgi:tetratricopeptide (TPR) repeat protein
VACVPDLRDGLAGHTGRRIGRVAEARGRYADAEAAYHKSAVFYTNAIPTMSQWESKPPEGEMERFVDWSTAFEGRVKVKQGRVGEGEADVRRALLSRLSKSGKFHADTAGILAVFVFVIQEQGRYAEAEQLQREVVDIYKGLGYGDDSNQMVNANVFLAQILNLERKYDDATKLYDQVDVWTAKWEPARRERVSGDLPASRSCLRRATTTTRWKSRSARMNARRRAPATRA